VTDAADIAESIREGKLAVLPTDTVYGLVCAASHREPAADLYRLKGRAAIQPTAVLFAGVEVLPGYLPELDRRVLAIVHALLPGPYTLVVPNPGHRFAWLTEGRPGSIGVRVPVLCGTAAAVVEGVGALVATSANLPGGQDPRTLREVPPEILAGVAAAVDAGELPGAPSTVIDVTSHEPLIIRAGAGDPVAALARIVAAQA
jgi:tRNA threonylcarbamoyl adenosine modification protein (Sua5/YciO/YrdC/YwlC family)